MARKVKGWEERREWVLGLVSKMEKISFLVLLINKNRKNIQYKNIERDGFLCSEHKILNCRFKQYFLPVSLDYKKKITFSVSRHEH